MSKISDLHSLFPAIEREDEMVSGCLTCRSGDSIKEWRGRERKKKGSQGMTTGCRSVFKPAMVDNEYPGCAFVSLED